MNHSSKPRILITTAGFGDGHNSAARNLLSAFQQQADAKVIDPCALAAPTLNGFLQKTYRSMTTHLPKLWHKVYCSTDRQDFSKQQLPFMRPPENRLHQEIREFAPHAIISTYPLYPYFVERLFQQGHPRVPVYTVVTDSIAINAAWINAPTDYWLVTDPHTKLDLINKGLPPEKIVDTGFAVHPDFQHLEPICSKDSCTPFRVLYFPTSKKPFVRRTSRAVFASKHKNLELTIVLGRNFRKLYSRAKEVKQAHPEQVKIVGWTKRVAELISSHHIAIGKAGGATVHEAIAATCPMLVHHLVPGQEEGNLNLLKHFHGGELAEHPKDITDTINRLLNNDAQQWRAMKRSLEQHRRPSGAQTIANLVLKHIAEAEA